jgi:D-lactate dehydrogenase
MINSSLLQMKDNITYYTSRGALINTTDIIEALKNGKVGYLGIDVLNKKRNCF